MRLRTSSAKELSECIRHAQNHEMPCQRYQVVEISPAKLEEDLCTRIVVSYSEWPFEDAQILCFGDSYMAIG